MVRRQPASAQSEQPEPNIFELGGEEPAVGTAWYSEENVEGDDLEESIDAEELQGLDIAQDAEGESKTQTWAEVRTEVERIQRERGERPLPDGVVAHTAPWVRLMNDKRLLHEALTGADARMRAPNKAGGKAAKWTENILSLPAHPVFQGPVPDGWKINGHGAYESLSRLLGFDDKAGDDTEAAPGERSFVMHGPGGTRSSLPVNTANAQDMVQRVADAARQAVDAAGMASDLTTVAAADEDEFARDLFVTRLNYQHPGILAPKEVYTDPLGFPSEHPRFRLDTCALVGNAGALLTRAHGTHIDRYPVVMRLNRGYSAGFEPYVGRRTTFRVLSSKALKRYLTRTPTPPEDRNATLLLVEPSATDAASLTRLLAEVAPRARVLVVARQTVGRVSHLLKGFKSRVAAAGLSIHHRGGNSPSTGLVALYVLMQMCRKVTGYGMGQALERAHGLQLMNAWPSESENAECYAAPANQNTVNKRPPFTYFGKAASTRESMQVWQADNTRSLTAETDLLRSLNMIAPQRYKMCAPSMMVVV